MFEGGQPISFLLAFLPSIIYGYAILFFNRERTDLRTGFTFFMGGFLSIMFVHLWTMVFPNFQDLLFITSMIVKWNINISYDFERTLSMAFYCFIQIGLLEETMKVLSIRTIDFIRNEREINGLSIMIYTTMAALGFAAVVVSFHDWHFSYFFVEYGFFRVFEIKPDVDFLF